MTKLNSNCNKNQKNEIVIKKPACDNSEIKIVTKLKNSNCESSKNQMVTKLKFGKCAISKIKCLLNPNCGKTKRSSCDKTQKLKC